MSKPNIFISYSRKDQQWVDRLRVHLQVVAGNTEIWDDSRILPGELWQNAIQNALRRADVALLVVSADYLASDFASNVEVPALLERQQNEGLRVLPVIVRTCAWHEIPWLRSIQFWPRDARPLAAMSDNEIDRVLLDLAEQVAAVLDRPESKQKQLLAQENSRGTDNRGNQKLFFISHAHEDGDFAELLQARLEKEGYEGWIDNERLKVGMDWRMEIDQTIKESAAVLVVMSPQAKESEYVTYEWAFAWGVGVTVIPIMLQPTPLHPRLETLQFLDFTNRAARPWEKLMRALSDS